LFGSELEMGTGLALKIRGMRKDIMGHRLVILAVSSRSITKHVLKEAHSFTFAFCFPASPPHDLYSRHHLSRSPSRVWVRGDGGDRYYG
jgi:hypothetical protein